MFTRYTVIAIVMIVLTLVTGCVATEPTAAPVSPTDTPLPPTSTALPAPTTMPTSAPPTPVTVANQIINAETVDRLEKVAAFDLPDSFVNTIVFSPDSRTMITGDRNGQVLMWERETWKKIPYLPARSNRAADSAAQVWFWGTLALSPDGNVIVTAYGDDGAVTGRDREGQELFALSYGARVYSVAISPNGKFLAVGGLKNNIIIFDIETQQPAADLTSDHEYIMNVVFSPDGKTPLAGYERPENVMKTWDTATWQETATFTHVAERIDYHDVLFSPDGKELVIASTENVEIKFLDLATREVVREFPEHRRAPYQIAFSPDGSLLASASDDGTLRLWDVQTGVNVKTIRTNQEAGAVAWSPDGTLIAVSVWGKGVQVWAVTRSQSPAETRIPPTAAPVSPTTVDHLSALENLGDPKDGGAAVSPDGTLLAIGDGALVKLWRVESGKKVHTLNGIKDRVYVVVFSPDSSLLVLFDNDFVIKLWDVENGHLVSTFASPGANPMSFSFSPDGTILASGHVDHNVRLWNVETGEIIHTLQGHTGAIDSVSFSPDGSLLASGEVNTGYTIKLWDVASGQEIKSLAGHRENVYSLSFSPDGKYLASASGDLTLKLWDVESGQGVRTFRGHGDRIYSVIFSPDGALLASGSSDRTVRLWDVESGQALRVLRGKNDMTALGFSTDGSLLFTGDDGNPVIVWGIPQ